ncbi:transporter substrate-binding domain-containing protein [Pseudoalteromonas sp. MMG013]|uniref:HD domain-containing phosphohydrolase n=1 Tax=Pseudoalteromonas sp. MMG013 TaxID=2822687 RepID=UPI001B38FD33|nr:HD domain-containing phosphohydrolase [Pseudoalteromonas sp. MMG013]MBQ4862621.1 transporter substrate-binding domain-containing protein [Pseudoalteromonas sp. MMG013]
MQRRKHWRFSVRITVVTLFAMVCSIVAALTVTLQYYNSIAQLEQQTVQQFDLFATSAKQTIHQNDLAASRMVDMLALTPNIERLNDSQKLRLLAELIATNPAVEGIYFANDSGSFFEVINLKNKTLKQSYRALENDAWVIMHIDGLRSPNQRKLSFFNTEFELSSTRIEPTNYNPTKRPWYINAKNVSQRSTPYLFQYTQIPGVTYFRKLLNQNGVIGLDIPLHALAGSLERQVKGFAGEAYLIKPQGDIIATNRLNNKAQMTPMPPMQLTHQQKEIIARHSPLTLSNETDWFPVDYAVTGEPNGYAVEVMRQVAALLQLDVKFINGYSWPEFIHRFKQGNIHALNATFDNPENQQLGIVSNPYGNLKFALIWPNNAMDITSIAQLGGKTLAVAEGWSVIQPIKDAYPTIEILEVNTTIDVVNAVLNGQADVGIESDIIVRNLLNEYALSGLKVSNTFSFAQANVKSSIHLLLSHNKAELMPLINLAIAHLSPDYLTRLDEKWLNEEANSHEIGRIVPYLSYINTMQSTQFGALHHFIHQGKKKLIYVDMLKSAMSSEQLIVFVIDQQTLFAPVYHSVTTSSLITLLVVTMLLPLTWLCASPIVKPITELLEMTHFIRAHDYSQVKVIPSKVIEVTRLSLAMKRMADELKRHEYAQRSLIDSIIKLIAQAIDEKSRYTAGHCKRVPELGEMLAQAACDSHAKPFKHFSFNNAQQWREFKTAAWLHDCGKITTPEHIVDKGSKLECIYNRIHEIRMRFEVLYRDAEIKYLTLSAKDPEHSINYAHQKAQTQQQLFDDFAFIANANIGSEFMCDADKAKIHTLAAQTWVRHFDDSLGLAPLEALRYQRSSPSELPAVESLLANKNIHIVERLEPYQCAEHFNIKMSVPDNLANRGEIYNLCISRGTLTAEDRFKINEHIISTIKILDSVPFPPELANVPRIASTHHETMRGDGYPRQLSAEDLSIPERILALADIFEALTAADRPYKKAKPLSVALKILHTMAIQRHIDIDVFELFITSGVYLDYARQFLPPEQIDDVDINALLTINEHDQKSARFN